VNNITCIVINNDCDNTVILLSWDFLYQFPSNNDNFMYNNKDLRISWYWNNTIAHSGFFCQHGGPGSIPGLSMWDLWWTAGYFINTSLSPSKYQCSIFIHSFIHHVRHHNGCSTKGLSLIPRHDFREKIKPLSCQDGYLNIGTWFMKTWVLFEHKKIKLWN
jgi:hypothetical protein